MENNSEKMTNFDVPKKPRIFKTLWFGIIIILIFIGGFLLWAFLTPLESAAIAPGKIMVAGSRRTIQHLEGGIVKTINVRDGSTINKGEVLLTLDDTQAEISYSLHKNEVLELLAIEARLIAERDNKKQITFDQRLLQDKNNPKVSQIIQNQESLFQSNLESFQGNMKILEQRIEQLNQQINGLQANVVSANQQIKLIDKEEKSVAYLAKRKLIEESKLLALQREAARLHGSRGESLAKIAALKEKIGETKLQMSTLKKNQRSETLTQLRDTQQKLVEAIQKEKAAEAILKRTIIRSPITGIVVNLHIHTIGGVIRPGEDIMDIVPTQETLVAEAMVSPLDIDVVHPGLKAKVQLTAFKTRSTPILIGEVTTVSADAMTDEKNNREYYIARIKIDKNELDKLQPTQKLYPGMPVQVMIITDKLTPWQYFIAPVKQSFGRAFREQ